MKTKTAEEINQKSIEYAKLRIKELIDSGTLEPSEDEIEDIVLNFERGYMACQSELSQFQEIPEITDGEIEKWFPFEFDYTGLPLPNSYNRHQSSHRYGAKWYRDKLKENKSINK